MNIRKLAQKYIDYGITWLMSEFDNFKGMSTIITTDEKLNNKQLKNLCNEIKKDERVKTAIAEYEEKDTITIIFNK